MKINTYGNGKIKVATYVMNSGIDREMEKNLDVLLAAMGYRRIDAEIYEEANQRIIYYAPHIKDTLH